MKPFMVAVAFGLALLSMPAAAQDRSRSVPENGGTGIIGDPGERMRSETERLRSLDRRQNASPMTSDPRLGPGTGVGGGPPSGSAGGAGPIR